MAVPLFLQVYVEPETAGVLSVTEPPVQRFNEPEAETVAEGRALTVSVREAEAVQPVPLEMVQEYVPAVLKLEMVATLAVKPLGPVQL